MALVWRPGKRKRWEVRDRKKRLICVAYADGPKHAPWEKISFTWPHLGRKIDRKRG